MAEITIRISSRTLKVAGLILGGICLSWIGWYVWSEGILLPKYKLSIYVPEAYSLNAGAPARLDGIDVGTVETIKVAGASANNDRRIEIGLRILKRYQNEIRDDSIAKLETEGLLGSRYISIQRGFAGAPIAPGGEIRALPSRFMASMSILDLIAKAATCIEEEKRSSEDKSKAPAK